MLGPRAGVFTDENIPDEADDEDLRNDPVSKMDMTVSTFYLVFFCLHVHCGMLIHYVIWVVLNASDVYHRFLGTPCDVLERMRVAEYKQFCRADRADKCGGDVDYTASSWIM